MKGNNTMKKNGFIIIYCILIIFFIFSKFSIANITVDDYCQLTILMIQQDISNYQKLISIVQQYKNNPKELNYQNNILKNNIDKNRKILFSSFNIKSRTYYLYMGENSNLVNSYLNTHYNIKVKIKDLANQRDKILNRYESLIKN